MSSWIPTYRRLNLGLFFQRSLLVVAMFALMRMSAGWSQNLRPPEVDLAGKFEGWQDNFVKLKDPQGNIVVGIIPRSEVYIQYTGQIDRAALKPGMLIRFQGATGSDGKFISSINQVEWFTPNPINRDSSPIEISHNRPGIYYLAQIEPAGPSGIASPDARVVGEIQAVDGNSLALLCGETSLKVEVAPELRVTVSRPSLEWAQSGDSIYGKGVLQPESGQLTIHSLTVVGAKPLAAMHTATKVPIESKMKGSDAKVSAKEKAAKEKAEKVKAAKEKTKEAKSKKGKKSKGNPEPAESPESESTSDTHADNSIDKATEEK